MDEGFGRLDGRIDQAFEGANAFAGTAQARVSKNFVVHGGIGYGEERRRWRTCRATYAS